MSRHCALSRYSFTVGIAKSELEEPNLARAAPDFEGPAGEKLAGFVFGLAVVLAGHELRRQKVRPQRERQRVASRSLALTLPT